MNIGPPMSTSPLTPVKVRGKRDVLKSARSQREQLRASRRRPDPVSTSIESKSRISRLEDLPTEILEMIFLCSGNTGLPLVSSRLLAQLSHPHIKPQIMDVILMPLISDSNKKVDDAQVSYIEHMLSRRFCTLELFRAWLDKQSERDSPNSISLHFETSRGGWAQSNTRQHARLVRKLASRLCRKLHLPSKVLHGPWTDERIQYLRCLGGFYTRPTLPEYPDPRISSYDGINDAIKEQAVGALASLLILGAVPDEDVFRTAIVYYGCRLEIVSLLFHFIWRKKVEVQEGEVMLVEYPEMDFLDPILWSWADQAEQVASGKGKYVKNMLKCLNDGSLSDYESLVSLGVSWTDGVILLDGKMI